MAKATKSKQSPAFSPCIALPELRRTISSSFPLLHSTTDVSKLLAPKRTVELERVDLRKFRFEHGKLRDFVPLLRLNVELTRLEVQFEAEFTGPHVSTPVSSPAASNVLPFTPVSPSNYSSTVFTDGKLIKTLSESNGSLNGTASSTSISSLDTSSSFSSSLNGTGNDNIEKIRQLPECDDSIWSHVQELDEILTYLNRDERCKVIRAIRAAILAHNGQRRRSGEPFVTHPICVCHILAELRMDCDTLVAALLHDTVEDTDISFADIEKDFGPTVRKIVEGETKISALPKNGDSMLQDRQAENLRQMLVAMTEDLRVIIVKLADRLHNMRTLKHMPVAKQKRIAQETLEIFAPLAHRLGIEQIRSELQDLAFRFLYPAQYVEVKTELDVMCKQIDEVVEEARSALEEALQKNVSLQNTLERFCVQGRIKEPYSIWKKMQTLGKPMREINDLVALRVVFKMRSKPSLNGNGNGISHSHQQSVEDQMLEQTTCYNVLGTVHSLWQPLPGKVKDYIATPKPNGYQSLHTTVITHFRHWFLPVEVQIRSEKMHLMAEHGSCAHWLFKEGFTGTRANVPRHYAWLHEIRAWQTEFTSSRDFVEAVRRDLLGSRVFVFTPQGQIINLPKGASVVDLAYHIHTEVGHSMVGCKVNGRYMVDLSYTLQNADVVHIITAEKHHGPLLEWLNYCQTRSARQKIRAHLMKKRRLEGQTLVEVEQEKEQGGNALSVTPAVFTPPSHESALFSAAQMEHETQSRKKRTRQRVVLKIDSQDRNGLLGDVAGSITSCGVSIVSSKAVSRGVKATLHFAVKIHSPLEIDHVIEAICTVQGVTAASVVRSSKKCTAAGSVIPS
mmetsp:Transcript_6790/g.10607  ORF Transcript_6790/g.10607 Transcript_6790/m.10607 type:complete len:846 (-) Transcript_6790:184-2721(-)